MPPQNNSEQARKVQEEIARFRSQRQGASSPATATAATAAPPPLGYAPATTTAPSPAGFSSTNAVQQEIERFRSQGNNSPTESRPVPAQPSNQPGFLETLVKDPFETLLVKPADRFAEMIGRTGVLGQDIKRGYEDMADSGESRRIFGVDVESQRAFGDGGAKQIGGEGLKTLSYLYGGGAAAGGVRSTLSGTARQGAMQGGKALAGTARQGAMQGGKAGVITARQGAMQGGKVGAISGGAYGAGEEMTQKESTLGSILAAGATGAGLGAVTGGALGAAAPVIGKALSPTERAARRAETTKEAVRRVAQGSGAKGSKSTDQAVTERALRELDLDGVKSSADLSTRIKEKITDISKGLDEALETDPTRRKLDMFNHRMDVDGDGLRHNFVSEALDQLETHFKKTNFLDDAARISKIREKANREGLTLKEVNNIARTHGKVLSKFNLKDELATDLGQKAENTRAGVKATARAIFGKGISKEADAVMADLSRLQALIKSREEAVELLRASTLKPGISDTLGNLLEQAVNIATLTTSRSLFNAMASRAARQAGQAGQSAGKTLNALDLENRLAKDLKIITDAQKKGVSEKTMTEKLREFVTENSKMLGLPAPDPSRRPSAPTLFTTPKGVSTADKGAAIDIAAVESGAAKAPKAGPAYRARVLQIQNKLEPYLTPGEMAIIDLGKKPRIKSFLPEASGAPNVFSQELRKKVEKYLTPEEMEIIDFGKKPRTNSSLPEASGAPNVFSREPRENLEKYLTPEEMAVIDFGPAPKKRPRNLKDIYID